MKTFLPAESFPPGEYLREELHARGWTQGEFARIIGRPIQTVNQIVTGKKRITAETALAIGEAMGTSAQLWLNLQSSYDLWKAPKPSPAISKRALALAKN
jgi:HTH-type transcriptional regulator/antitoxin HigA